MRRVETLAQVVAAPHAQLLCDIEGQRVIEMSACAMPLVKYWADIGRARRPPCPPPSE